MSSLGGARLRGDGQQRTEWALCRGPALCRFPGSGAGAPRAQLYAPTARQHDPGRYTPGERRRSHGSASPDPGGQARASPTPTPRAARRSSNCTLMTPPGPRLSGTLPASQSDQGRAAAARVPPPTQRAGTAARLALTGNDYVSVPYAAALNNTSFTVAAWAKVTGGSGHRSVLTSREGTAAARLYALRDAEQYVGVMGRQRL